MGTSYQITIAMDSDKKEALQSSIDKKLAQINQLMSTYIEDSELSVFNQTKTKNCLELSEETIYVIKSANEVSKKTAGKFDITLAPLIEIWGFDKKQTNNKIPEQKAIQKLLSQIGYQKIQIQSHCIAKQNPSLSVNLSAIAKGYAVDQIAEIISRNGYSNYLVEIGGEIANSGVNARGLPWRIAIESAATDKRSLQRSISPKGMGIATSGDYRNYFEKDGQRFSHTIDPTTGYPINHRLASVTVLHKETMLADAFATAMMVMGPEASLKFANKNQLAIFMLVKNGDTFNEVYSQAFDPFIE